MPRFIDPLESRLYLTITPDPGDTFDTANNTGTLYGAREFSDAVGPGDSADILKFVMASNGHFAAHLQVTASEMIRKSLASGRYLVRVVANGNGEGGKGNYKLVLSPA